MPWILHLCQERHTFHLYHQAFSFSHLEHVHKRCNRNSKVINSWFSATPSLLWCYVLNKKSRTSIQDMDAPIYCFWLKALWNSPSSQQASHHVENSSIFSFQYTILLWCISSCEFPSNTVINTKIFKCF